MDNDKNVDDFIEKNSEIIDGAAYEHLHADRPVIPLKILYIEMKIALKRDLESREVESLDELDPQRNPGALENYVEGVIRSLEWYLYTKNRIGLYNKVGIGLNIALEDKDAENDGAESEYKVS